MAKRTFAMYTIASGGTPQPLIGTKTSAAVVVGSGGYDTGGYAQPVTIPVSSSAMFQAGDWAVIGTIAGGDQERIFVQSVPSGTSISAKIGLAHASGVYVRLAIACESIYIQTKQGNAAGIYVGTQGMSKSGQTGLITILYPFAAPTQPVDWTDPVYVGGDGAEIADFWVDGTTSDGYMPSLTIL